jgi:hypothetical protein
MEDQIKKLRESGFSDEDIQIYINSQQSSASAAPTGPVNPAEPMDVNKPPKVDETVPDYGKTAGTGIMEDVATVGAAVAPYAGPAALGTLGLGGAYGLYKFGSKALDVGNKALDVGRNISGSLAQQAETAAQTEARLQQRPGFGGAPRTGTPTPTPTYNVPTSQVPQTRMALPAAAPPMTAPPMAAPAATPPAQSNNWMAKAVQMAKQAGPIVEQYTGRAAQAMAPVARVAGAMSPYITAAQGLTYSKGLGPAVPSAGPYRGMEINPQTGRGWTPEELNAANAAAARGF